MFVCYGFASYYSHITNQIVWRKAHRPTLPSRTLLSYQQKRLTHANSDPLHHVIFSPGYKTGSNVPNPNIEDSPGHTGSPWYPPKQYTFSKPAPLTAQGGKIFIDPATQRDGHLYWCQGDHEQPELLHENRCSLHEVLSTFGGVQRRPLQRFPSNMVNSKLRHPGAANEFVLNWPTHRLQL